MTAPAEAVAKLARALTPVQRNVLGQVAAGRTRYLSAFPADVAAIERLTAYGLVHAREGADGRPFLDVTSAGRAVLKPGSGS